MNKGHFWIGVLAILICSNASAQSEKIAYERLLTGNEPSYLVHAFDDESHEEFFISIKYRLFKDSIAWMDRYFRGQKTIYFTYNGKYDFFFGSRFSSPIISRRQNPGLVFVNRFERLGVFGLENLKVGWHHESNGQHIETKETFLNTENAEDFVSRGWDYLGLEAQFTHPMPKGTLYIDTRIRIFCDCQAMGAIDRKEDAIFWKDVARQPDVRDFNGFRSMFSYHYNRDIRLSAQFRFGTHSVEDLKNVSYKLEATIRFLEIPLTMFYFDGYGKELSTYHQKDSYVGFGLEFW
ncbi:MAG: phospholipase A [Nitrospiria bacterium]